MNVLVLGPQGSGKGTQAKRVSAEHDIPHVSTGDMFRALDDATPLGREVNEIMERGDLVPDEITIRMIRERLADDDARDGFILDGFPRNLAQAEALDEMLREIGRGLDVIFFFDLDDDDARRSRALGRAHEEGRTDDTPETIARRLAVYHEQTEPVVEYYRTTGKLVRCTRRGPSRTSSAEIEGAWIPWRRRMIIRKSAQEIAKMAAAGRVVAETIAHVGEQIEPGITTGELDRIADEHIRSLGGVPTSQDYRGYPKAICISPNDMVVHGIPGAYEVADGDLITIDVGVTLDGYIADSAFTFPVGDVSEQAQRLLDAGRDALAAGIAQAQPGNRVGDISAAVQQHVEGAGFSVVRSLVGHGVGRSYHEDPHIPNFGQPGRGPLLSEGMTLAIEPMITAGRPEVYVHDDEWSISTEDGSLAAHFEHTVAITAAGPRILTESRVPLLR